MREKWNKKCEPRISDGHPVPQKLIIGDQIYNRKLHHSPSLRAIRTYNELSIDSTFQTGADIPISENIYSYPGYGEQDRYSNPESDVKTNDNLYDYATMGTLSLKTTNSAGSELNSDINEMGSTVKLVPTKMEVSCQLWLSRISTTICTISMAAGIGNLYRLPQITLIRGGLPFFIAYVVLTILIGLPLLFLELGLGQLAQEGFIKSWRAVPFFRGIGYVKLAAGYMLSIYYPLYMGLALYYIIWIIKEPFPFQECSSGVKITESGYSAHGRNGQQCLRETFLKSPFTDPYWYGIYAGLMLLIWIIITLLCFRKTKSYSRSLIILFFPTMICYITLMVKSVFQEEEYNGLEHFLTNINWKSLTNANVWYYACIQVFFSTNVGFGPFITNAGVIYNKVNPLWTALGYVTINVLLGSGSIIISHIMTGNINATANEGDVAELHLMTVIYDTARKSTKDDIKCWLILAYLLIILAGLINMATLMHTILKAVSTLRSNRLNWWQISLILSFIGYVLGCAVLLQDEFDIVHLFDHYIVGNLILITVIIEVFALITFYGTERIKSDFEFMLGHILSKIWLILWWLLPLILTAIFAWGMITLPLEGIYKDDPEWLYGVGWGIVLTAFIFIFITGFCIVGKQDGYTLNDKIKASLKPSTNWGPADPMSRHTWIQWNSKAQQGEKDFTLKRQGTKDYTRSIKKNARKAASDIATSMPGVYLHNGTNQNILNENNSYSELYNSPDDSNSSLNRSVKNKQKGNPLRVTSLIDSFDYDYSYKPDNSFHPNGFITNLNPLARTHLYEDMEEQTIPEGYDTLRKGPYIVGEGNIGHVCYRRYSESEDATEL